MWLIVPEDFDWTKIFDRNQVTLVRNDFGRLDRWPRVARRFIREAGCSGSTGFSCDDYRVENHKFEHYGHSDYFCKTHFEEHWIPTLRRRTFSSRQRQRIVEVLNLAAKLAATKLALPPSYVRANVFVPRDERVEIAPGLYYNMDNAVERTISIPIGTGCAGRAFEKGKPTVAIFKEGWGDHDIPDEELAKVDRRLRWIVSMPIFDGESVIGTLNVDGLDTKPDDKEISLLEHDLWNSAQIMGRLLGETQ